MHMPPVKVESTSTKVIEKSIIQIEIAPLTMALALLMAAGAWMLIRLLPVLLVLVAALMIVGTLSPVVQWIEARNFRRNTAIALVFGVLFLLFLSFIMLTFPVLVAQISSLIEHEPQIRARLVEIFSSNPITVSFAGSLRNLHYDALIASSRAEVLAFSKNLVEIFAYGAATFFLALYMMIDRDRLRGAAFSIVPRSHHILLSRILLNLQMIVGAFVRGQVITSLLIGVFVFCLLTVFDIPNALTFAVVSAIVDVLPFIGIFLTVGPIILAALAKGPLVTAIVFITMLCYEEFESRVLIPVVYGHALRLPSSIILFAFIAGGTLSGIVGAFLALLVAATIFMLVTELRFDLPGEENQIENLEVKEKDEISSAEYERRTEGMSAEEAAAVALEISSTRQKAETDLQTKSNE